MKPSTTGVFPITVTSEESVLVIDVRAASEAFSNISDTGENTYGRNINRREEYDGILTIHLHHGLETGDKSCYPYPNI